ncbi:response regulator transcription factor [Alicyclobacillus sp. SO9]|uniref:response regulator transcription factor n=1 Tax=Alicyclobacillus sp. SO9 TaxID=2665646 RepID=UPI0018E86FDA|nr:response regulator transcription factor [Alicyclobacillus sp. SO9]QQE80024.1 response regulator transcription factor [Alicyclobacillus sp. SO9]
MRKIRVFIADDQALVREGIKYILDVQEDMEVVAEAENGRLAVDGIVQTNPDVVLMDIRMPDMDGISATREVLAQNESLKVVVLTTFNELTHVVDAIRAGAVGFLLKDAEPDDLIEGVRAANRGEAFFRTEHASRAMTTAVKTSPHTEPVYGDAVQPDTETGNRSLEAATTKTGPSERITERELDVLQEMAYGRRNSEIARNLHVSEGTVKTHIHHILDKLGVEDRTQAVVLALRQGLVK